MLDHLKNFISSLSTKAVPLSSPAALDLFAVPPAATRVHVDAMVALRVPAVAQGVRLVSEAVATLDWRLCREGPGGRETIAPTDHPVSLLLQRPSPWLGETELKRQVVQDMLMHGAGMALVSRVRGEPRELHRVDPRSCSILQDMTTGEPRYSVAMTEGGTQDFSYRDIVHLRGPTLDGVRGLGLTTLGADAIGVSILLETHAAGLFSRGARPAGVLEVPGKLTSELVSRLRESFSAIYGGTAGAGRTAVLESGVKFQALQLSSVDAQFIELRKFQISEIARALNLPAVLLNDLENATLSNAEHLAQQFLDRTITPIIELFEDALDRVLLTDEERDAGYEIEFDTSNFVRADTEKRFAALKTGIESGVLTLNEARDREGLPAVDGGDTPMRSVQTLPLTSQGAPGAETTGQTQ